jgi:D-serine deaminase-like pyridoxal phosphate-dependent protein
MTTADLQTPALIVDVGTLDRNIARMAEFFADGPCKLRPHVKAHKTPEIARRQLAAGCSGLTCATVHEAEAVAHLGADLLIANEIVDASKCDRLASLARNVGVTVAVDSPIGVDALAAAAQRAGVTLGVLVDLDVGQGRCGVVPGQEALTLAHQVSRTAGLELRGVMGYEGHLQATRSRDERAARTGEAMRKLVATAELLLRAGLPCDIVSAGGTGTYDVSGRTEGITEIQAGSYALMDTDYRDTGVPFEQAFWVLGTVISRSADRCVVDAGHKSMTKDHGNPSVHGIDGAVVSALNDEHAVIALPPGAAVGIGDRLRMIPSHTDPTVNLHDVFYAIDDDHVVDRWAIARGYAGDSASAEREEEDT